MKRIALLCVLLASALFHMKHAEAQLPPAAGLVVGSPITGSCTSGYNVYSNGGVVGCQAAGTGSVATFSAGTTGLTPNSATSGAVTLAGVLIGSNGGTGVNNGSSTLTLAASLATTGAGAPTLAFPGSSATFTYPGASDTLAGVGTAQTWTAVQTFTNSDIRLLGSSTGYTVFSSANAGASNFTLTFPAATDTVVTLAATQALTNKTYNGNTWTAGTGTLTLGAGKVATISNTLTFTGTDSSSVAFGAGGTVLYAPVALASLATQATNTVVGNATSGTAAPTALAVGTCSTAGSALNWTTNTGFGCNTSITAAAVPASGLTGATLASGVTASSLTSVGASLGVATGGDSGSLGLGTITGGHYNAIAFNNTFGVTTIAGMFAGQTGDNSTYLAAPTGWTHHVRVNNADIVTFDGTRTTFNSLARKKGYTVSTLPGSPLTGDEAYVTDAVACTFLATVTGGGAAFCPVVWNGSNWQGG